jgi:cbb3-type cytochrome oxidase cytochrome c subunit
MRHWFLRAALVLFVLLGAGPFVQQIPWTAHVHAAGQSQDPTAITVYVTKTGEKYHRDGCRYLRRSKIPMSLKEAAARYGPCSVCKPPTMSQD